eukprot:TRINITY_DN19137_c0_g1_i1.p1 TRINITY_DN19137_c0_g1~~TRINITY_DN19137_c0_g1_i1.p1  ORF type:complete len:389 (-),score=-57.45 TRINITY_DN19137_c0_g1_i1:101-1189(-)
MRHTVALLSNGVVYSWGYNQFGQLGDGTTTNRLSPTAVEQPWADWGLHVTAIAAGAFHTIAVLSNNFLFAWGQNTYGQLGDSTTTDSAVPTIIPRPEAWDGMFVSGISVGYYHSVALLSGGSLYSWGSNSFGQLGDGTWNDKSIPTAVSWPAAWAGLRVSTIATGGYHTVVVLSDGQVFAWGRNEHGQLGDGTVTDRSVPTAVIRPAAWAGREIIGLAAGYGHTVALLSSAGPCDLDDLDCFFNILYAWGLNDNGQLGDGTKTDRHTAVAVARPAAWVSPMDSYFVMPTQISAGYSHTVALVSNGDLYAWGENGSGRLGDGTSTGRTNATAVVTTSMWAGLKVDTICAGWFHTLANLNSWGV